MIFIQIKLNKIEWIVYLYNSTMLCRIAHLTSNNWPNILYEMNLFVVMKSGLNDRNLMDCHCFRCHKYFHSTHFISWWWVEGGWSQKWSQLVKTSKKQNKNLLKHPLPTLCPNPLEWQMTTNRKFLIEFLNILYWF